MENRKPNTCGLKGKIGEQQIELGHTCVCVFICIVCVCMVGLENEKLLNEEVVSESLQ